VWEIPQGYWALGMRPTTVGRQISCTRACQIAKRRRQRDKWQQERRAAGEADTKVGGRCGDRGRQREWWERWAGVAGGSGKWGRQWKRQAARVAGAAGAAGGRERQTAEAADGGSGIGPDITTS